MAKAKSNRKTATPADNRKFMFIALGLIAVVAIVFTVKGILGSGNSIATNQAAITAQEQGGVQVINMKVSAAGYAPNNFVVKKGVPVKIVTDSTADAGCVRGFMMPDLGINQALNVGKDEIDFTPTTSGDFTFTCQMRMSTGSMKVI